MKTSLKCGAEGCEKILDRMDDLIADFQNLRCEMGKMAQQMEQMQNQ